MWPVRLAAQDRRPSSTADTIGLVMPPERSLDIDTEPDLQIPDIRHREVTHGIHPDAVRSTCRRYDDKGPTGGDVRPAE